MRDFLLNLYGNLYEYFKEYLLYKDQNSRDISLLLDHLYSECFSYENITDKYEDATNVETKISCADEDSAEATVSSLFSVKTQSRKARERGRGSIRKVTGSTYRNVVFPNVFKCIDNLSKVTNIDFVLLIDEWSNLPLSVQPHFAEFLRCCFIPSRHITVKIAAVGARTSYFIKRDGVTYGLEIGADISVAMDLDRLYMCDRDPNKTGSDLYKILWKQLKAKNIFEKGSNVSDLTKMLFNDPYSPLLLVRASEGNPRDFISIVNYCIVEMDGVGGHEGYITAPIVFRAANSWYNFDKHTALGSKQRKLLSEISAFVIQRNRNRGFVIKEDYLYSPPIVSLIDARVLHVLQTECRFPDLGIEPMAILVLDFGTYSQELLTKQKIHFLIGDDYEEQVFGKVEAFPYDMTTTYPLDESRKFRLCFLGPELSKICPSFTVFN